MPYTTRADNDVITASSHNANCRDQVVSTVTSGTRPSGTEGQIIYETDTDRLLIYNGGWIQLGGTSATALNSYTTTIDQGASTNIAKTTVYSQYQIFGNWCCWSFALSFTAAGTAGSQFTLTTPVTMASTNTGLGSGKFFDTSTTITYNGMWIPAGATTTMRLIVDNNIANSGWGVAPNLAVASGDTIYGNVMIPIA